MIIIKIVRVWFSFSEIRSPKNFILAECCVHRIRKHPIQSALKNSFKDKSSDFKKLKLLLLISFNKFTLFFTTIFGKRMLNINLRLILNTMKQLVTLNVLAYICLSNCSSSTFSF